MNICTTCKRPTDERNLCSLENRCLSCYLRWSVCGIAANCCFEENVGAVAKEWAEGTLSTIYWEETDAVGHPFLPGFEGIAHHWDRAA